LFSIEVIVLLFWVLLRCLLRGSLSDKFTIDELSIDLAQWQGYRFNEKVDMTKQVMQATGVKGTPLFEMQRVDANVAYVELRL
jgi:hypothetical protein